MGCLKPGWPASRRAHLADFISNHTAGKENVVADTLSRPSLEPAVGPKGREVSGGHSPSPIVANICPQPSLEPAVGSQGREVS
jgi:hypothetical protein